MNSEKKIPLAVRALEEKDRSAIPPFLMAFWHSERMVARGRMFFPARQDGIIALRGDEIVGLASFEISAGEMELTLLDSRERNQGLGTRLLEALLEKARQAGCRRVWLVTTNDNIRAIRFYQKRGFDLAKLHRNALEDSRKLKPEIPLNGQEGIPIRHELEFELIPQL